MDKKYFEYLKKAPIFYNDDKFINSSANTENGKAAELWQSA